jgi:hypothetical protein
MGEAKAQFGSNTSKEVKRVYFEGSTAITEGMPLCYNFDTTSNVLGYDKANSTFGQTVVESATTAEGYQNEGKFLRVEIPATANLQWFAGVVAPGNWCGSNGPKWIEIYVPNGAIVPVLAYLSAVVGKTAMAIMNGQTYFGNPNAGMTNGAARWIAVAEETVDRSSTAGLVLARLNPTEFLYQSHGTTKLQCGTTNTVDVACNFINVQSQQATGGFTGLWVRAEVATAANTDTSIAMYSEANVTGVAAASPSATRSSLNVWGGTQTCGYMTAHLCEIYEEGANLTGGVVVAPLFLRTQIDGTNPPAASTHYMIYCSTDGADKPDGLLYARTADSVGYATTSNVTGMAHIPIYIGGVGIRYILLEDTQ